MAKTTLILDDACVKKVRRLARQQGKTMTQLVNEMLAEGVRHRETQVVGTPVELPWFCMGRARVELADRSALEGAMVD